MQVRERVVDHDDPQYPPYSADFRKLDAQSPSLCSGLQGQHGRATVLLADDNPRLRLLLATTLTGARYTVIEAADGDQAWELLQQSHPQATILDVQMTGRTGLELCELIRQDPGLSRMAVVVLAALADPGAEDRVYAAGADAYLPKPYGPIGLLETIDLLLQRAA
jgi:CheY-like chemotaxis protein